MRGELLPAHLPGSRSRSEQLDDWVMESAQRLERLWGERIQDLQIVVQEIPDGLEDMTSETLRGLLGSSSPAAATCSSPATEAAPEVVDPAYGRSQA